MSEALPILYSFRRCPYAMRARMAIAVSDIRCELREVSLRDKPPSMIEASQKGTVPVLKLLDGAVIDESIDVMHWALGQNDPYGWRSINMKEANALIEENDGQFKHHLDRYKYSTRYEGADKLIHRDEGVKFLKKLDDRLQNSAFLFGEAPSFADIAIFPFVRQFRIADPDWFDKEPFAKLQSWLRTCTEMQLFQRAMIKHDPWKDGDKPIYYP